MNAAAPELLDIHQHSQWHIFKAVLVERSALPGTKMAWAAAPGTYGRGVNIVNRMLCPFQLDRDQSPVGQLVGGPLHCHLGFFPAAVAKGA